MACIHLSPPPRASVIATTEKTEEDEFYTTILHSPQNAQKFDVYYLLDVHWFHCFHKKKENSKPICNTPLLVKKTTTLKPNLRFQKDYMLVPSHLWEVLQKKYTGGPEISRLAHKKQEPNDSIDSFVDIYPISIQITCIKHAEQVQVPVTPQKIEISAKNTISDLFELLHLNNVSSVWSTNLRDHHGHRVLFQGKEIMQIDPSEFQKTFYQLGISNYDKTFLVIEHLPGGILLGSCDPPKPSLEQLHIPNPSFWTTFLNFFRSSTINTNTNTNHNSTYPRGLCGLSNLGNTCFFNSAVQCLSNTVELHDYLHSEQFPIHINRTNPLGLKGKMAEHFALLIKQMWSGTHKSVSPRKLHELVRKNAPQFIGYGQHDSQEVLSFLLDGLHEDLNLVSERTPYKEIKDDPSLSGEELARMTWNIHKQLNQSVVVDLFQGQLRSTITCFECRKPNLAFDPFMYLSVPIPTSLNHRKRTIGVVFKSFLLLDAYPHKYNVVIEKDKTVEHFMTLFQVICKYPVDLADLCICKIHKNQVHSFIEFSAPIEIIQPGDLICIYHLYPLRCNKPKGKILENKNEEMGFFIFSLQNFDKSDYIGIPDIMKIDTRHIFEFTCKAIYKNCRKLLSFYLDPNAERYPFKIYVHNSKEIDSVSISKATKYSTKGYLFKRYDHPLFEPTQHNQHHHYTGEKRLSIHFVVEFQNTAYDMKKGLSVQLINASQHPPQPMLSPSVFTLKDCLDLYTDTEQLSSENLYYCNHCKASCHATKKLDIWRIPKILIIHLKRFSNNRFHRKKVSTLIDFPLCNFDLQSYIKSPNPSSARYNLFAVSNHYGGMGGGHYTTSARNKNTNQWVVFNDNNCTIINNPKEVISSEAYVLFYQLQLQEK